MAFPTGWTHRFTVTIDRTKVTGTPTGFILLVTKDMLPSTVIDAGSTSAQEGGGDLRFTTDAAGTTRLPCEVVDFSPNATAGSRRCEIYVNMNGHEPTTGADKVIYGWCRGPCIMHQPAPSNPYGAEKVWSDLNYRAVHHLLDSHQPRAGGLWLMRPRAIEYAGATYVTWLDNLVASPGSIMVAKYTHATGQWTPAVTVAAAISQDGHAAPTICVSASGFLHIVWANYQQAAGTLITAKSTNAGDISAWGAPVTVSAAPGNERAYPCMLPLSNGHLVLFERDNNVWKRWTSTDSGATWGNNQSIIGGVNRSYAEFIVDAADRVHVAWHYTGSGTGIIGNSLGYAYTDNASAAASTWKAVDGTAISAPIDPAAATSVSTGRVFDNAGFNGNYLMGVAANGSSLPMLSAWLIDTATLANSSISAFRYSGGAWSRASLVTGAGVGQGTAAGPSGRGMGGTRFVSGTTWRVLTTMTVSSKLEVQEFESTDSGATWAKVADITSASTYSTNEPQYVRGSTGPITSVMWGCDVNNINGELYNQKADLWFSGDHTDQLASWARTAMPATGYFRDSSLHRRHGTKVGSPANATGLMSYGGVGLTVTNGNHVQVATSAPIAADLLNSFTVLQWVRHTAGGTTEKQSNKGPSGGATCLFSTYRNASNGIQFAAGNGSAFCVVISATNPLTAGVASRVASIYDGLTCYVRIGKAATTGNTLAAPLVSPADNVYIGNTMAGSTAGFRITPSVLGANLLDTEFDNQNSPSTFATGAESALFTYIDAAATAQATATGTLTTRQAVSGAAAAVGAAAGALSTGIILTGEALGEAGATGAVSTGIPLVGAAAAVATVYGNLGTPAALAAAAVANASAAGALSTGIVLAGAAAGRGAAVGALTGGTAVLLKVNPRFLARFLKPRDFWATT